MTTEKQKAKNRDYQRAYRARHAKDAAWVTLQTNKRREAEKKDPKHAEKKKKRERAYYKNNAKRRAYLRQQARKYYSDPTKKDARAARRVELREQKKQTPEGRALLAAEDRRRNLKRNYGLTVEQVDALWERQGRACAICSTDLPTVQDGHIDHCHETNKVRGLLCMMCNVGLGSFKENIKALRRAAAYIRLHRTSRYSGAPARMKE